MPGAKLLYYCTSRSQTLTRTSFFFFFFSADGGVILMPSFLNVTCARDAHVVQCTEEIIVDTTVSYKRFEDQAQGVCICMSVRVALCMARLHRNRPGDTTITTNPYCHRLPSGRTQSAGTSENTIPRKEGIPGRPDLVHSTTTLGPPLSPPRHNHSIFNL